MKGKDIPNRIADALGCGSCICREDCLTGKPFKDCHHSVVLPKLVTALLAGVFNKETNREVGDGE